MLCDFFMHDVYVVKKMDQKDSPWDWGIFLPTKTETWIPFLTPPRVTCILTYDQSFKFMHYR